MAKVNSLIKYQGTLDGVTIDKDGTAKMAAKSRTITSNRTKENNSEFAVAAKQGKVALMRTVTPLTGPSFEKSVGTTGSNSVSQLLR
jgi:hypothetical protein